MRRSECFRTIQGEGLYTGYPSVFFRVSGCNLRCAWSETNLCDTPYTSWNPEGENVSVLEAAQEIINIGINVDHIVLTGGEPFLYAEELDNLCVLLKEHNKFITIETNGTIYRNVRADLISLSPKLSSSTPTEKQDKKWNVKHEKDRLNYDVIRAFQRSHQIQVKFVISNEKDLEEVYFLQREIPIPITKIVLMPEGLVEDDLKQKQEWLAKYCIEQGYRYSDRLHVRIWGNRRGV